MSTSEGNRAEQWKEALLSGVMKFGALTASYPMDSIAAKQRDAHALQVDRFQNIFARIVASSDKALVFGVGNRVLGSAHGQEALKRISTCEGSRCEVAKDIDQIRNLADFFADCSRDYVEPNIYASEYPSYSELVCCFVNPDDLLTEWLGDFSLWDLGCPKTPYKGLSNETTRYIRKGVGAGQLMLNIALSYAGTKIVFYIPAELRTKFVERIFDAAK